MSQIERPNPPAPGKLTHFSVDLFWKLPKAKESKVSVVLQRSNQHHIEYETVYTGFAKKIELKDLEPSTKYNFRLKYVQDETSSDWSAITEIETKKMPLNGDDLHRAVLSRALPPLKKLLEMEEIKVDAPDKYGSSALMSACIKGYVDVASLLISYGANVEYVNSAGKTCLMMACYHGNISCIELLNKHKVDWRVVDRSGSTAFHWAIDGGQILVIEMILKDEITKDLMSPEVGGNLLMRLVNINGKVDIAKMLISEGGDVNYKDKTGKSVLMAACLNGNKDMTEVLVNSGASVWAENEFGKTAYDMAKAFDRRAVVKYLEEFEQAHPRPSHTHKAKSSLSTFEH